MKKSAVSRVPTEVWELALEQVIDDNISIFFDTVCKQGSFYDMIGSQDNAFHHLEEWEDQLAILRNVCHSWCEWVELRAPRHVDWWGPKAANHPLRIPFTRSLRLRGPDADCYISKGSRWKILSFDNEDPEHHSSKALKDLSQHQHYHPHLRKLVFVNYANDVAALRDLPKAFGAFQSLTWLEFQDKRMCLPESWWPSGHKLVLPKVQVVVWKSACVFPSAELVLPSLRHLSLRSGCFLDEPMAAVQPFARQLESLVLRAFRRASHPRYFPIPWELFPKLRELTINFAFDKLALPNPDYPLERLYLMGTLIDVDALYPIVERLAGKLKILKMTMCPWSSYCWPLSHTDLDPDSTRDSGSRMNRSRVFRGFEEFCTRHGVKFLDYSGRTLQEVEAELEFFRDQDRLVVV
jgi:hypothetical protein